MSDTIIECKAKLRCKDCLYCVVRNNAASCHIGKPLSAGFPKTDPENFCGYLTIPETMARPYYRSCDSDK